jgi:Ethanolamine utilization protein EutJ (predicted chaperonin)
MSARNLVCGCTELVSADLISPNLLDYIAATSTVRDHIDTISRRPGRPIKVTATAIADGRRDHQSNQIRFRIKEILLTAGPLITT